MPCSKLLVGHGLDAAAVLDLHFPRHQKRKDFQVGRRLIARDLLDGLLAPVPEVHAAKPA